MINKSCATCAKFLLTLVFVFTIASNCSHAYGADTGTAPADFRAAIVWVAEKNIPAVAHIDVIERQEVVLPFQPFENDPFFRYFFDAPQMPRKYKREVQGLGTGIIMDAKGHILTNNHVVVSEPHIRAPVHIPRAGRCQDPP